MCRRSLRGSRDVSHRSDFRVKSVASVTGRIGYAWDRFLGTSRAAARGVSRDIISEIDKYFIFC